MIDRDPENYSVELLGKWRSEAEDLTREELGKTLPDAREMALMQSALYKRPLALSVADAVGGIVELTKHELERRDPRFAVDVRYEGGVTNVVLKPRESLSFHVAVNEPYRAEFAEKWQDLVDHGTKLEIGSKALIFTGSPLLDDFQSQSGRVQIGTNLKRKAIQKMSFRNAMGGNDPALDDFQGQVTGGRKSFVFDGSTFDGLYSLSYRYSFPDGAGPVSSSSMNMTLNSRRWEGRSIVALPYAEKLFLFIERVKAGTPLYFELEIDGRKMLSAIGHDFFADPNAQDLYGILRYLRNAKDILKIIGADVIFPANSFELSSADAAAIEKVWHLLFEYPKTSGKALGEITCGIEPVNEQALEALVKAVGTEAPGIQIQLIQHSSEALNIVGERINVPPISLEYSSVNLSLEAGAQFKLGESSPVKVLPRDECVVTVRAVHP
jgi:hypothetical protein